MLLIGPLGTDFSEFVIEIIYFHSRKCVCKMAAISSRPRCVRPICTKQWLGATFEPRRHLTSLVHNESTLSFLYQDDCDLIFEVSFLERKANQFWRNLMMTSSNGNIFRVTGPLCGEFTGPGEFPTQRPVTRSFDVFYDLRLNKRLSIQPWGWWFETPSWSLWRHNNLHECYSMWFINDFKN